MSLIIDTHALFLPSTISLLKERGLEFLERYALLLFHLRSHLSITMQSSIRKTITLGNLEDRPKIQVDTQ